jgi:hypothetical protein
MLLVLGLGFGLGLGFVLVLVPLLESVLVLSWLSLSVVLWLVTLSLLLERSRRK